MDNNPQPPNEYFLKKEEKEKIRREEDRKRIMSKFTKWLIAIAILVLLVWQFVGYFKKEAIKNPAPGEYFPAQNREHIKLNEEHPAYNSNPPTGGWHYDASAQTGIYDRELSDEQLVHNLEHSHVWISYTADLPKEQVERLAEIAKDYGSKIIMTLRPANDMRIAVAAWQYLIKMDEINEEQIREFIDAYRGLAGPEKIPDRGFKDFRGSD